MPLDPAKRTLVIIGSILATALLALSFLNPWFSFDDLIYYSIIAAIIIGMLACNDGSFRGIPGLAWSTRTCGGCGRVLPKRVRVGMRCPHCGVYLGGELKSYMGVRVGESFEDDYPSPTGTRSRRQGGRSTSSSWKPRRRSAGGSRVSKIDQYERTYAGPTGYESPLFTARSNCILPGDQLVPEDERKRAGRFDDNPDLAAFNPPFEGLFKDQSAIKNLFSHFLNWAAIGASLRRWVKAVQENPHLYATSGDGIEVKPGKIKSDAEIDAVAKLEAWKEFERKGFTDPLKLPDLYKDLVKQQEDADKPGSAEGGGRAA